MAPNLRSEDTLEGEINYPSWKTQVLIIWEENNFLGHVEKYILELKGVG